MAFADFSEVNQELAPQNLEHVKSALGSCSACGVISPELDEQEEPPTELTKFAPITDSRASDSLSAEPKRMNSSSCRARDRYRGEVSMDYPKSKRQAGYSWTFSHLIITICQDSGHPPITYNL